MTATIISTTGHLTFTTYSVAVGSKVYVVDVCIDIAHRDHWADILVWGASRLSADRRRAIGAAVTTDFARRAAAHQAEWGYHRTTHFSLDGPSPEGPLADRAALIGK